MVTECLSRPEKSVITKIQKGSHPGRRILVADDEPDIRLINTIVLTRVGYMVDAV